MNWKCLRLCETGSGFTAAPNRILTPRLAWLLIVAVCGYPYGIHAVVLQEVAALGDNQLGELVLGSDGNFYGVTQRGGTADKGTVFQATPEGVITTLVSFTGTNGAVPWGSLIRGADGNLYGTTSRGGANDLGSVFRMSPDGKLTTLASFSGPDGALPGAALCQGHDGQFYGTAYKGGAHNWGCVFRVNTNGVLAVLASFSGESFPGSLVQKDNGILYGITAFRGANDDGTIFQVSTNGAFRTLFSFAGDAQGFCPQGGLIVGGDGYLYGTTTWGGNSADAAWGYGTLFRITQAGALSTLVRFNQSNGERPMARLVQTEDGSLYGTTSQGGAYGRGTIFKWTSSGQFSSVLSFDGTNGALAYGGLTVGKDGDLYGVTSAGSQGGGTFFRMAPEGAISTLGQLQPLDFVGAVCEGPLFAAHDGSLYGCTSFGGAYGRGTILKINPAGRASVLASFTPADGFKAVQCQFTEATDGNLYGTTCFGGVYQKGTLFRLSPSGELKTVFSFQGANGNQPYGLVQATDGHIYGITVRGGDNDGGTVFRFDTNGALTTLIRFSGANGSSPATSLMQASDGNLYGSTEGGGSYGQGTIFRLTTGGLLRLLVHFNGSNGSDPLGGRLMEASDGYLYGTTFGGGSYGKGTVFRVTTNGVLTTLVSFRGSDGSTPWQGLLQSSDGYLYGTTLKGGAYDCGTVYRISTNGVMTTLVSFDGINASAPFELSLSRDGSLYMGTGRGGSRGGGNVFRVVLHSIEILQAAAGNAVLNCSGVPYDSYDIQTTTSLVDPIWETITTCSADENGLMQVQHNGATSAPTRFYRLASKIETSPQGR